MNPTTKISLLTLLILLPYTITARENQIKNLIKEVCEHTTHKGLCISSLEADSEGKQFDLPGLALLALRLASANASDTSEQIKSILGDSKFSTLDPAVQQSLSDCADRYLDAVEQLDDSVAALLANAYDDVHVWVEAAIADAVTCEEAINGAHDSLLAGKNSVFHQLCDNALAINQLLSSKN